MYKRQASHTATTLEAADRQTVKLRILIGDGINDSLRPALSPAHFALNAHDEKELLAEWSGIMTAADRRGLELRTLSTIVCTETTPLRTTSRTCADPEVTAFLV